MSVGSTLGGAAIGAGLGAFAFRNKTMKDRRGEQRAPTPGVNAARTFAGAILGGFGGAAVGTHIGNLKNTGKYWRTEAGAARNAANTAESQARRARWSAEDWERRHRYAQEDADFWKNMHNTSTGTGGAGAGGARSSYDPYSTAGTGGRTAGGASAGFGASAGMPDWLHGVKTQAEAKSRFRAEARKHHPDAGGSTARMQEINAQWAKAQKHPGFPKVAMAAFSDELFEILKAVR